MSDFKFTNYGQSRDIDATDGELGIFDRLQGMTDYELELVRKSDNYITAALGDWDIVRFKYTDRAKWIMFPLVEASSAKNRISSVDEVLGFQDKLSDSLTHYEKYR